jgi:hypothetical protein
MNGCLECPHCGNPLVSAESSECPKCNQRLRGYAYQQLLVADVAHSGESWEEAERKIIRAVDQGIFRRHKGVKIVHGYGTTTGRSVIRDKAIELLRELARQTGGRFVRDDDNPGAHILWLNR